MDLGGLGPAGRFLGVPLDRVPDDEVSPRAGIWSLGDGVWALGEGSSGASARVGLGDVLSGSSSGFSLPWDVTSSWTLR